MILYRGSSNRILSKKLVQDEIIKLLNNHPKTTKITSMTAEINATIIKIYLKNFVIIDFEDIRLTERLSQIYGVIAKAPT